MANASNGHRAGRVRRSGKSRDCSDCGILLSTDNRSEYLVRTRRLICTSCWSSRQSQYTKDNPNYNILKTEKARARRESWSEERKLAERRKSRGHYMKRTYGISLEKYDDLLKSQLGLCAICRTDNPGGKGDFHVDHCHDTKKVRGLLCQSCNIGLGHFKDSIKFLESAIEYLRE